MGCKNYVTVVWYMWTPVGVGCCLRTWYDVTTKMVHISIGCCLHSDVVCIEIVSTYRTVVIFVLKPSNGPETKHFISGKISVSVEAFSSKCSVSSVEKHTEFYFCAISCYMLLSLFSELLKSSSYENV